MRLVCPSCGAIASRDAWENDAAARQFDGVLIALPPVVQRWATPYIGLFRKGERGLSWKVALKLVRELKAMIDAGRIQWDRGETRPAPPELWAEIMEYMVHSSKTGLSDHNYLRKVVWERARGMASRAERAREECARRGVRDPERVSAEEREGVKGLFAKFRENPKETLEEIRRKENQGG